MLGSIHMLTGAAIGKVSGDFALVIPVAFLSHFVLDLIPHMDPETPKDFWKLGISKKNAWEILFKSLEPLVGIAIILSFSFTASSELGSVIFWGAFFAAIPDVVEFLGRLLKSRLVISFFEYAHSSLEGPRWWYTQWVIGGVALVVLLTC
ncbi:hypothetical protein HOE67_03140 [Candidatus Peregrinibacteria bacterium]|jgi:hypothetical protein|nr:hypothetical protein [Candidatus Peregrinibacteria bacterium]MBT4056081.1 hypothetical protein [Candidatus Peregrinibacteria bacterium]